MTYYIILHCIWYGFVLSVNTVSIQYNNTKLVVEDTGDPGDKIPESSECYVCVYMYICIYIYIYIYIYVCVCGCVFTYLRIYMYMFECLYV